MTDGQEESVDIDLHDLLIFLSFVFIEFHGLQRLVAQQLFGLVFPEHLDVFGIEHPFLHGLRCPQFVPPHNQVHLLADACQVSGFFGSRISTPYNGHCFVLIKEPVAGGARGNPESLEPVLGFQSQVLGGGPGGQDDHVGFDQFFVIDFNPLHFPREIHTGGQSEPHLGPEALGLLLQILHHGGTIHTFRVSREIIHLGGGGQLSAHLHPGIHHRFEVGPGRINGSGITGRARSQDQASHVFGDFQLFLLAGVRFRAPPHGFE